MKTTKKLFATLLAVMTVMILSVPALAAGDTGTITVDQAIAGQTYGVYKIFSLEISGENYIYTHDPAGDWNEFVTTGAGKTYVAIDSDNHVTWKQGTSAADFAKAALAYAKHNDIIPDETAKASGTSVTFSGLELGYYLVDSSVGALVMLDSLAGDSVTITEKNYLPNISKQVQEDSTNAYGKTNDADFGQAVNFQITIATEAGKDGTVAGDPDTGAKNYVLHDEMATGLTLDPDSFSVTLNDAAVASENYTVTTESLTDGCGFEVAFKQTFLDKLNANDKLVVSYSATLNENAVVGGAGNVNSAKLTYGDSQALEPSTTTTYTWDMDVFKYTGTDTPLDGAKFKLSRSTSENDAISFVNVGGTTTYKAAAADAEGALTEITTDTSGRFTLRGLDAGTYYLIETAAPTDYNKLDAAIEVVISQDAGSHTGVDGSGTAITINYVRGDTLVNGTRVDEVAVLNSKGAELPATGGIGTTIFYVLGSILVVGAVVLLVARKRMHDAE